MDATMPATLAGRPVSTRSRVLPPRENGRLKNMGGVDFAFRTRHFPVGHTV